MPGLRDDLGGFCAVNIGVYVPGGDPASTAEPPGWIQEYHCMVRVRLARLEEQAADFEVIDPDPAAVDRLWDRLARAALPLLERLGDEDSVVAYLRDEPSPLTISPARICLATLLLRRGDRDGAREQLSLQVRERADHPGHQDYVRELANELGLGPLDDV